MMCKRDHCTYVLHMNEDNCEEVSYPNNGRNPQKKETQEDMGWGDKARPSNFEP